MGRGSSQMVTYNDLIYMVNNEGFTELQTIPAVQQCMTKADVLNYVALNEDAAEWITWSSNRLVPYRLLIPSVITWQGAGAVCEDDSPPVDNPPTAPTIVLTSKTTSSIDINWTSSPGTDDNGIVEYEVTKSLDGVAWETGIMVTGTTWLNVGLPENTLHYFRVRAFDNATPPQSSPWSNVLQVTTDANPGSVVLTSILNDTGTSNDTQYISIFGKAGDTVTCKITIHSGTAGTCSRKWKYWTHEPSYELIVDGSDLPGYPVTHQWNYTLPDTGTHVVASANAYRSGNQVGFEASTTGTFEIIANTGADPLPPDLSMDINATSIQNCT